MTDHGALRKLKRSTRRDVIRARDGLDPGRRTVASARIARRVMSLPEMQRARTVHLFASFGSEVDTGPLMDAVLASERAAVLPVVVEQDWGLEHARVLDRSDLAPGFRGIPEPRPSCTRVSPADIDLVVTPGVAFDRSLWRLGYGGGFYDRFLEACSAPRVALAFSCQIVESVPRDDWDLPVHVLVTEDEVLRRSS